jgi:DNA polymerase III alpha subunit (gram-positive type)
METVAVLDFETTGLSPNMGDRATEIAITLLKDGQIIDRFQSLMNAGRRIPSEVVHLTGITNEMIGSAPSIEQVMRDAVKFVGRAHRAMVDAEMTSHLWSRIRADIARSYPLAPVSHALLTKVQKVPRVQDPLWLQACSQSGA